MFLSVVILGGFTTEARAMAHLITTDRPDDYSPTRRTQPAAVPLSPMSTTSGETHRASTQPFRFGSRISERPPLVTRASRRRTERRSAARPQTSPTRFTALPRHHNAPERVGLPGG
jgi:hypothetical protein